MTSLLETYPSPDWSPCHSRNKDTGDTPSHSTSVFSGVLPLYKWGPGVPGMSLQCSPSADPTHQ